MQINKSLRLLFYLSLNALFTYCSVVMPAIAIELNQNTVQIEGWLSSTGEWTLFQTKDFESYNPYINEEDKKCVSLINSTELPRSEFQVYHGKKVTVFGIAIRYDDLPIGNSIADQLLSKKYFNEELVINFCLRDFVFAVSSVSEEKD